MSAFAPTLQTTYTGAGGDGSATTSITVGAGSNQVLIIIACTNAGSINTPTYGGSSTGITLIASRTFAGSSIEGMWYLLNPTQTTANLAISGTNNTGIQGYLFSGVDLSSPIGTTGTDNTASVATSSVAITTDRNNSIVVSGIGTQNATDLVTTGTNQTLGTNVSMGSGSPRMADSTQTTTTAGSYTQGFSIGGGTATRGLVSAEIHGIQTVDNTLVLAQGSYTLTGQVLNLRKAMRVLILQGSYALTGQVMGFGRKIIIAMGSYTVTGQSLLFKLLSWVKSSRSSTPEWPRPSKSSTSMDTPPNKSSSSWNNTTKS